LRDTEVQQPKVTATLSLRISSFAFSANRSQSEAGSTTTGSIILPLTPPLALISSMAINTTSLRDVSEIAMVPLRECRMPTLTVPAATAWPGAATASASAALIEAPSAQPFFNQLIVFIPAPYWGGDVPGSGKSKKSATPGI